MKSDTTCRDCGAVLDDTLVDGAGKLLPCPNCGCTRSLKVATPGVATVGITAHDVTAVLISYPDRLLVTAKRLFDEREYSVAVVVAHMGCEIAVQRAISNAFKANAIGYLEMPVRNLLNGYSLNNENNRDLLLALTGKEVQKQPFWDELQKSTTRRNRAIHAGVIATEDDAARSIQAALALIAFLQ